MVMDTDLTFIRENLPYLSDKQISIIKGVIELEKPVLYTYHTITKTVTVGNRCPFNRLPGNSLHLSSIDEIIAYRITHLKPLALHSNIIDEQVFVDDQWIIVNEDEFAMSHQLDKKKKYLPNDKIGTFQYVVVPLKGDTNTRQVGMIMATIDHSLQIYFANGYLQSETPKQPLIYVQAVETEWIVRKKKPIDGYSSDNREMD